MEKNFCCSDLIDVMSLVSARVSYLSTLLEASSDVSFSCLIPPEKWLHLTVDLVVDELNTIHSQLESVCNGGFYCG